MTTKILVIQLEIAVEVHENEGATTTTDGINEVVRGLTGYLDHSYGQSEFIPMKPYEEIDEKGICPHFS